MQKENELSLALYCQQYDIDTDPANAWVLQNLDGECYVEKIIERFQTYQLFKRIYLLVGEGEEYSPYTRFAKNERIKVVHLRKSDYLFSYRYTPKAWNLYDHNGDMDFTPVWIYQVMLGFQEEYIFSDSIFNGFAKPDDIKKAFMEVQKKPDHFASLRGALGRTGILFSRYYLQTHYFPDKVQGKNKLLNFKGLENPIRIIEDRDKALLNFESIHAYNPGLYKKSHFDFMKKFYQERQTSNELQFRSDFDAYLSKNIIKLKSEPSVLRVRPQYGDHSLNLKTLNDILSQLERRGRLTVILDNSWRFHKNATQLLESISQFKLHGFLETDGNYPQELSKSILTNWDIVQFTLNEISPQSQQLNYPDSNAELIFSNLWNLLHLSQASSKPQIGIYCQLTQDDSKNKSIIDFWRARLDFNPLFGSVKEALQGHITPCIQFVRYQHPDILNTDTEKKLVDGEIFLDADGSINHQFESMKD